MQNNFVHLHLHSEYSLLDGVQKIFPLIEKISQLKMPAVALTDHGYMYGIYEFWSICRMLGVKPILGCEVYVAERTRFDKEKGIDDKRYHLTLLAKNLEGYHNLCRMVSLSSTEGFYYKPRVDKELIGKYGHGIIALTGCQSSKFDTLLRDNKDEDAIEWLDFLKDSFDDVYIELTRCNIPTADNLVPKKVEIAEKTKTPYVATVDIHYLEKEDYKIQEIAWCISDGKKLKDEDRRKFSSTEFYVKTADEMVELFDDLPDAISNTVKIADSIEEYSIEYVRIQPEYHHGKKGEFSTKEELRNMVYKKVKNRYENVDESLTKRIDYELEIIDNKGYNDYFLVVQDYIAWARSQGILVGPGRGSGAGSIVAYILGITNIDPLKWDLIFERFLNPERPSPPDFDVDFQDDRRDELFKYMSDKYGKNSAVFITTFGRLKTKVAIRDVARVMDIDLSTADKLSKMVIVKFGKVSPIKKMMEDVPEFAEIIHSSPDLELLAQYVAKLENIARHMSIHACGYLVTPKPVVEYLPVQLDTKGSGKVMTQYEGMHLENIGVMKFDFLGLTNLTIISKCLALIKERYGKELDLDKISLEDEKTFNLFQRGDTLGVFQFESDGMQKYLIDLAPTELDDLIFLNAAYRPGPMAYIQSYINRKNGVEPVEYPDPSIEGILKPTFGFAIYQEQVINIAVTFAGYSLGEADLLRRAMGKKKKEIMDKEKIKFIEKSIENGHTKEKAEEIFSYLEPFADYGFNRSHAACYAIIGYQTAYLKANYPLEFMAALMEVDFNTPDKLKRDLKAAKKLGIKILIPDINKSKDYFSIENDNSIRFGLSGVKGVGQKSIQSIVNKRPENGYESLHHLIKTVGVDNVTKKDLECLIKVGSMDMWGYRNQLLEAVPLVYETILKDKKNAEGGQTNLFMDVGESKSHISIDLPTPRKEREIDRLNWEKEMLGTFLSKHPLQKYSYIINYLKLMSIDTCKNLEDGERFQLISMISNIKVIITKKEGNKMAFVTLEDQSGTMEAVIFPKNYEKLRDIIKESSPILVSGRVSKKDDSTSLVIENIKEPEEIVLSHEFTVNICGIIDRDELTEFKDILCKNIGNATLNVYYGNISSPKLFQKKIFPSEEILNLIEKYNGKKD